MRSRRTAVGCEGRILSVGAHLMTVSSIVLLAFAEAFDGLSTGIFVTDASARIIHANLAGEEMLRSSEVLWSAHGRLAARNTRDDRTLREVFASIAGGKAAQEGTAFSLEAKDGQNYVAQVLRLSSGGEKPSGPALRAAAVVFVRKAELESGCSADLIARTYNLTPAETRVLRAIVEVGGVPETAEALEIAEATVKTHLHRVFAKTGASRQADLVKLTAAFSHPLGG